MMPLILFRVLNYSRQVCAVAANPGHTKELQSVQLERSIRIVDSPGVVFDDDDDLTAKGIKKGSIILRNVVKVEDVEDPIAVGTFSAIFHPFSSSCSLSCHSQPVEEVSDRTTPALLCKIYDLPEFNSTLEFLAMLALKNGKLLKGGTPDLDAAAYQVLTDWNHQKIPYHSEPPPIHPSLIPSLGGSFSHTFIHHIGIVHFHDRSAPLVCFRC